MELFQLGFDYLQRFPNLIQSLSADDVMSAVQQIMDPDELVLSVAGP